MFSGKLDWRSLAAVGVLIAVTLAVYGGVCGHEFTWWDDPMTLHHNPRYNPPSGQKIAQTWKEPVDGLYAPVTYSYWGALAYLAEAKDTDELGIHLDARVFHLGSLLLHLGSVLVVFAILKLLGEGALGGAAARVWGYREGGTSHRGERLHRSRSTATCGTGLWRRALTPALSRSTGRGRKARSFWVH